MTQGVKVLAGLERLAHKTADQIYEDAYYSPGSIPTVKKFIPYQDYAVAGTFIYDKEIDDSVNFRFKPSNGSRTGGLIDTRHVVPTIYGGRHESKTIVNLFMQHESINATVLYGIAFGELSEYLHGGSVKTTVPKYSVVYKPHTMELFAQKLSLKTGDYRSEMYGPSNYHKTVEGMVPMAEDKWCNSAFIFYVSKGDTNYIIRVQLVLNGQVSAYEDLVFEIAIADWTPSNGFRLFWEGHDASYNKIRYLSWGMT